MILYHTLDIAETAQWYSKQLSSDLIGGQCQCTSFSLRSSLTTTPFSQPHLDGQLECSTPLELIGVDFHSQCSSCAIVQASPCSTQLVMAHFSSLFVLSLAFSGFTLRQSHFVRLVYPSTPLHFTMPPYVTLSAEVRSPPYSRSNSQTFPLSLLYSDYILYLLHRMCRWIVYFSHYEPILLADLIIRPQHSLVKQGQLFSRSPTETQLILAFYSRRALSSRPST